jgi:tetratricopeptide (TPR) repeat protein
MTAFQKKPEFGASVLMVNSLTEDQNMEQYWLEEGSVLKIDNVDMQVNKVHIKDCIYSEIIVERKKDLDRMAEIIEGFPSPAKYIDLSLQYYTSGLFKECIATCEKVIALDPGFAPAYNNICSSYNSLGEWEKAIPYCEKALELDPDFQLAKNNLKYARENFPADASESH